MTRQIIQIEEERCDGCGLCITACHEGAIGLVDGKAKLLRDDYCDGLGTCLPVCPTGAIRFIEREAADFDEQAVRAAQAEKQQPPLPCGCPGTQARSLTRPLSAVADAAAAPASSALRQWPVQIKLVPVHAPYFQGSKLLIAADCAAYAYADFHSDLMRDKLTLIGCPKLDEGDYSEKLTEILKRNDIKSVTVVRMEVPCCAGIEQAVKNALHSSGKMLPWQLVVLSTDGRVLER